jgi:hypothetical protein
VGARERNSGRNSGARPRRRGAMVQRPFVHGLARNECLQRRAPNPRRCVPPGSADVSGHGWLSARSRPRHATAHALELRLGPAGRVPGARAERGAMRVSAHRRTAARISLSARVRRVSRGGPGATISFIAVSVISITPRERCEFIRRGRDARSRSRCSCPTRASWPSSMRRTSSEGRLRARIWTIGCRSDSTPSGGHTTLCDGSGCRRTHLQQASTSARMMGRIPYSRAKKRAV